MEPGNAQLTMTVLMTPDMANFSGNVHGGTLLKYLDEVAYACASRYAGTYVVTMSVDQVIFREPVHVGELVTVGHSAILHACTVKDEVLVGMGAIVLDGAVIGERSIIGAGALVTGGTIIPPGSLVLGSPAKVVRTLSLDEQAKVKSWAEKYVVQSRKYLAR